MQDAAQALAERVKARQLAERVKARRSAPAAPSKFDAWQDTSPGETFTNESLAEANKPSLGQGLLETIKGAGRGALNAVASAGAQLADVIIAPNDDFAGDPEHPEFQSMFPTTQAVHEQPLAPQALQGNPRFAGSTYGKVGEGLGASAPIVAGGMAGVPPAALAGVASWQAAVPSYYEAKARGSSEAQATTAMLLNGLVGAGTASLPILDLFGKTAAKNPAFSRQLVSYLMQAGTTGADMQAAATTQKWLGAAIAEATGGDYGEYIAKADMTDVSPLITGVLLSVGTARARPKAGESEPVTALRSAETQADAQIKMREAESVQRGAEKIAAFSEKERARREAPVEPLPPTEDVSGETGPLPTKVEPFAAEIEAFNADPDVVAYRAAKAREQLNSAAAPTSPRGSGVATAPDSQAAAPSLVPHPPETRMERVQRAVGNTYAQLERMVRQEYQNTDSTFTGKAGTEASDPALTAYNQRRNESRQHRVRERDFYKPIKQGLRRAKVSAEEFGRILYARHAPEVNKLMAERNPGSTEALAGMTNQDAAQILAEAQAKPNWPQVEAQIKRFDEMVKSDVQRRVDAGLLTPEQARSYDEMYSYYAPLKTAQEGLGATGRTGIRGREFKRQTGRVSEADNPFISAVVQDQLGTSRIERNKVNVAASKFFANHPSIAKIVPESDFVAPTLVEGKVTNARDLGYLDRPDVVPFKEGGKQYALKFEKNYQSIAEVLRGEGTIANAVNATMRAVDAIPIIRQVPRYSGFVKRWVTRDNPFYWPINFIKDTSETFIRQSSERGLKFALKEQANAPKMLKELVTDGPLAKRYKDAGGMMPTMGVEDFSRVQNDVNKYLNSGRTRDALTALREHIERGSDAVENMHRLSVFDLLTREGMSDQRAALAAAEANVNFGKRGEIAAAMEALYPFYTASVNGTRALYNITKGPQFARVATTLVAGGVALDHRNRMVAGTDDNGENRYDKIPEYEKRGNIIWMDDNGSGDYTKIPLVPGVGWLMNAGRNAGAAAWGPSNSEEAGAHMIASLIDTLNPLGTSFINEQTGGMTNPASALSPTVARPALEVGINKDFADRTIEPENERGRPAKPDSERYKKNTSPTLIWATKLAAESGGPDVSPANLEHAIRGYMPGLFQELGRAANTVDKALRGEKVEARDIPGWRRFRGQDNPYFTEQKYYDNRQHALDTGDVARTKFISKFQKAIDALPNVPENEESRRELMALANKALKELDK